MVQLSFYQLCYSIRKDPLCGARLARREHQSLRCREYALSASAYALAVELLSRPAELSAFYQLPELAGEYAPNHNNLLLHCNQYIRESRTGPEADRAGRHARAMQGPFEARWTAEEVMLALEKRGGFSGLISAFSKANSQAPFSKALHPKNSSPLSDTTEGYPSHPQRASHIDKKAPGELSTQARRATKSKPEHNHLSVQQMLKKYIMIEMEKQDEREMLFQLDIGSFQWLKVVRRGDGVDGFKTLKGLIEAPPLLLEERRPSGRPRPLGHVDR